jgi:hypothetical protein
LHDAHVQPAASVQYARHVAGSEDPLVVRGEALVGAWHPGNERRPIG